MTGPKDRKTTHHVPLLEADHFEAWKIKIRRHMKTIDRRLFECVLNGPFIPMKLNLDMKTAAQQPHIVKPEAEWDDEERKAANLDEVAADILTVAIDSDTFEQVMHAESAKEMWDGLCEYIDGNQENKENKRDTANFEYDYFVRLPDEDLKACYDRFSKVCNQCRNLGTMHSLKKINKRFLSALGSQWSGVATTLKLSTNLSTLTLRALYAVLKNHEVEIAQATKLENKVRSLSLQAVTSTPSEPSSSEPPVEALFSKTSLQDMDQEEFALFVRKYAKHRKFNNFSKSKPSANFNRGMDKKGKGDLLCYNCRKPGHFASDCPQPKYEAFRKKTSFSKFPKRKGLVAEDEEETSVKTWIESDSDADSEDNVTEEVNLCLMAKSQDQHVALLNQDSSDDDEPEPSKPFQFIKPKVVYKDASKNVCTTIDGKIFSRNAKLRPLATLGTETVEVEVEDSNVFDVPEESEPDNEISQVIELKEAHDRLLIDYEKLAKDKVKMVADMKILRGQLKDLEPLSSENLRLTKRVKELISEKEEVSNEFVAYKAHIDTWIKSSANAEEMMSKQRNRGDFTGIGIDTSHTFDDPNLEKKSVEELSDQTSETLSTNSQSKGQRRRAKKRAAKLALNNKYPKKQFGKELKERSKFLETSTVEMYYPGQFNSSSSQVKPKVNSRGKRNQWNDKTRTKVKESYKAIFKTVKVPDPLTDEELESSKKFDKIKKVVGLHHCYTCNCFGHKAVECLLRFHPTPKGNNTPKVRQEWVPKRS